VELEVADNPDESRYEVHVGGELAGWAVYRLRDGRISFIHTEVDDRFEGQGIGSELVSRALDDARGRALEVLPFCPFVNAFLRRHREYADLVPAGERERFGL
jgi:predicted GNAT family acetyltransferase